MPVSAGSTFRVWRGGKNGSFNGKPGAILQEFRTGLGLADGIIVPSKVLLEDYCRYAKSAYLVENFLYPPLWENLPTKPDDRIVAGWGGSSGHYESWLGSNLAPALGALCRKYPKFHVSIQPPDVRIVGLLNKYGVVYETHPWCFFEAWANRVATFDITLAPLHGNYDMRRSNLKCLESATAGIPWVASNLSPYNECVGGKLVNNTVKEWTRALELLIESESVRVEMGHAGKIWATEFNSRCVATYERALGET